MVGLRDFWAQAVWAPPFRFLMQVDEELLKQIIV